MIRVYGYRGELKRLAESLNATNVLSDQYALEIFNMALNAQGEGYQQGKEKAESQKERR